MTKQIPGYLKLHTEDESAVHRPPWLGLLEAIEAATGWRLQRVDRGGQTLGDDLHRVQLAGPLDAVSADNEFAARGLVERFNELLGELQHLKQSLRQCEAELAAAPLGDLDIRPEDQSHLGRRLDAILKGAAEATGCDSAAIYMLDDDTRHLKLRSSFGLPASSLTQAPRPLRGAVADLEALVGHAVVLEDAQSLESWKTPEECRAAICVPISTPSTPLGTLWLYSHRRLSFVQRDSFVAELTAGRVASELERERMLRDQATTHRVARQIDAAAAWQNDRLPRVSPMIDNWQAAGWIAQARGLGGDFYDWCVLPDGRLAIAVGDAEGQMLDAALTSAGLSAAVKAHTSYHHRAAELIQRVNDTFWTSTAGDEFAALLYATIEPLTGRFEIASAGGLDAVIVGPAAGPLIWEPSSRLGAQPEIACTAGEGRLLPGQALVIITHGARRAAELGGVHWDPAQLAQVANNAPWRTAQDLTDLVRVHLLSNARPLDEDCTVVVLAHC